MLFLVLYGDFPSIHLKFQASICTNWRNCSKRNKYFGSQNL